MSDDRGRSDSNILKHKAFVETVRNGSLTRASEIVGVSQSGISRMISDLEHEWGVRLLERGRKGIALTPEGERLYSASSDLCACYDDLRRTASEVGGSGIGVIRIGTISSLATHRLPTVIKQFKARHPEAGYEILMGDYTEIERWIREGRVDLGFLPNDSSPGLVSEFMEDDELMAVLPENHPMAEKDSVRLEELCVNPFMLLERNGPSEVSNLLESRGMKPDVAFTTWDDYAIMSMVESGLGVSILPNLILGRIPYNIAIRHLDPPVFRHIYLVTRGEGRLTAAARAFISYLPTDADGERCSPTSVLWPRDRAIGRRFILYRSMEIRIIWTLNLLSSSWMPVRPAVMQKPSTCSGKDTTKVQGSNAM